MLVIDLVRHGEAVPGDAGGDRERRLSPQGLSRIRELASELVREGWRPDRVFSSPLLRALETATILVRAMGGGGPGIEPLDALEPDAEPAEVLAALVARHVESGAVALIGHQPLLGRVLAHLTGAEKKIAAGTLVRVECPRGLEPGTGSILRILSPADAS